MGSSDTWHQRRHHQKRYCYSDAITEGISHASIDSSHVERRLCGQECGGHCAKGKRNRRWMLADAAQPRRPLAGTLCITVHETSEWNELRELPFPLFPVFHPAGHLHCVAQRNRPTASGRNGPGQCGHCTRYQYCLRKHTPGASL